VAYAGWPRADERLIGAIPLRKPEETKGEKRLVTIARRPDDISSSSLRHNGDREFGSFPGWDSLSPFISMNQNLGVIQRTLWHVPCM